MEWLEQAMQLTVVLTFLGALFTFAVLRPLNDTLKELRIAIDGLRTVQDAQNERLHRLEGAVERIEKAVVTAHARIDKYLLERGDTIHERLGH